MSRYINGAALLMNYLKDLAQLEAYKNPTSKITVRCNSESGQCSADAKNYDSERVFFAKVTNLGSIVNKRFNPRASAC